MSAAILIRRGLAVQRSAVGIGLLTRPTRVASALDPSGPAPPEWIERILGARLLAQGLAQLIRPTRSTVLAGAAVDGLHAATMLAAAVIWPQYRRPAIVSGAEATAALVVAMATARNRQP